ncbi:MAG: hypothetical protein AVDCRST_MAG73-3706 [uncultured Thermomicrobiales bacterium]|uniref:Uncharacterized protein n=1 Tax=uncultured Thermomicrobiales bacterium TaxID=1645740 RepID=A0A6J4UVI5_9BACT|nr:MAG: hypothetical protein AVDCRST_MAG73-3706 [uncultured Thermomicrobiales bacterium]
MAHRGRDLWLARRSQNRSRRDRCVGAHCARATRCGTTSSLGRIRSRRRSFHPVGQERDSFDNASWPRSMIRSFGSGCRIGAWRARAFGARPGCHMDVQVRTLPASASFARCDHRCRLAGASACPRRGGRHQPRRGRERWTAAGPPPSGSRPCRFRSHPMAPVLEGPSTGPFPRRATLANGTPVTP